MIGAFFIVLRVLRVLQVLRVRLAIRLKIFILDTHNRYSSSFKRIYFHQQVIFIFVKNVGRSLGFSIDNARLIIKNMCIMYANTLLLRI